MDPIDTSTTVTAQIAQGQLKLAPESGSILPNVSPRIAMERRSVGYFLILAGIGFSICAVWSSLAAFDSFKSSGDQLFTLDIIRLSLRGVVSLGFVLFSFGLVQAGERLILPVEWVRTSEDLRLMLGAKHPATIIGKELRGTLESLAAIVTAARSGDRKE